MLMLLKCIMKMTDRLHLQAGAKCAKSLSSSPPRPFLAALPPGGDSRDTGPESEARPGAYLDAGFRQVDLHGQLLAGKDVRVVGLGEDGLKGFQLRMRGKISPGAQGGGEFRRQASWGGLPAPGLGIPGELEAKPGEGRKGPIQPWNLPSKSAIFSGGKDPCNSRNKVSFRELSRPHLDISNLRHLQVGAGRG